MKSGLYLFCLLYAFSMFIATAQAGAAWTDKGVWPESPAAATIREVTTPRPALLTGAAEFSIPLHTLSAEGLSLDFTMRYHSNGVRVNDEPCPWGYGWSLMPCIRMSRRIIGRPDGLFESVAELPFDSVNTHWMAYHCMTDSCLDKAAVKKHSDFYLDTAPDIFTVQLPDKQFSFIYAYGRFVTAGCDEYRIESDSLLRKFTITDPRGFIYSFDVEGEYSEAPQWLTEWYPSAVICPSGRKIQFSYIDCDKHVRNEQQRTAPCSVMTKYTDPCNTLEPYVTEYKKESRIEYQRPSFNGGKHLSSLSFEGEEVTISYKVDPSTHRRCADGIEVSYDNSKVKRFAFTYKDFSLLTAVSTPEGDYSFGYVPCEFHSSSAHDWWGFYNGAPLGSHISPDITIRNIFDRTERFTGGTLRKISHDCMKSGIMTSVVYPTGARLEWEYEPHRFDMPETDIYYDLYVENIALSEGGGLRVTKTKLYNGADDDNPQVTEYVYGANGNGKAVCTRVPTLDTFLEMRTYVSYACTSPHGEHQIYTTKLQMLRDSRYMENSMDVPIWYSRVEEISAEGKTVYEFEDILGSDSEQAIKEFGKAPHILANAFSGGPQMTKKTLYTSSDSYYREVSSEAMVYSAIAVRSYHGYAIDRLLSCTIGNSAPDLTSMPYFDLIHGFSSDYGKLNVTVDLNKIPAYNVKSFEIVPQRELLISRTVTEFLENGDLSRTEHYEYVDGTEMVAAVTTSSPGGTIRREYRYPSAASTTREERLMADYNILAMPVGEKLRFGTAETSTEALMAKTGARVFRPARVNVRRGTGADIPSPAYGWDRFGNMLSASVAGTDATEYTWDNVGRYPYTMTVGPLVSRVWWKKGVGVSAMQTPDGIRNEYTYDSAGRLTSHSIDGVVMQRWKYSIDNARAANYVKAMPVVFESNGDRQPYSMTRYDALGRPAVEVSAVPDSTGSGWSYTATATVYDAMGRPGRVYVPAPVGSDNPGLDGVASAAAAFHGDSEPYTRTVYEPSQRRLPARSYKAGRQWHNIRHSAASERYTNDNYDYRCPQLADDGHSGVVLKGYYPKGSLSVEESRDEDRMGEIVYTDMRGLCVKRSRGSADTYYVYNDYGDLCHILPPGLAPADYDADDPALLRIGYSYSYDSFGRLTESRLPGRTASQFRYDSANRLVAENNADLGERWRLYFYDFAGREVLAVETATHPDDIKGLATACRATAATDGEYAGYSIPVALPADTKVCYARYYDSYAFLDALPDKECYSRREPGTGDQWDDFLETPMGYLTGMYTGDDGGYEAYYYDFFGREIECVATAGYSAGRISHRYNLAGQVIGERREFPAQYGLPAMITRTVRDAAGRPMSVSVNMEGISGTELSAGCAKASTSYSYDAIGRPTAAISATVSRSFEYDLHGWLRRQSARWTGRGATTRPVGFVEDSIVERLYYADGATPRYNGFISSRELASARYDYRYDNMGRLTAAEYSASGQLPGSTPDFSTEYEYDQRGNITALRRYGLTDLVPMLPGGNSYTASYGLLDDLEASYNGNMICEVAAAPTQATTFAGRAGATLRPGAYDLRHDNAGRLTYDETRNIVDMRYNSLGQLASLRHSCGDLQTMTYDGLGRKLGSEFTAARTGAKQHRRYYASGLVTCNDTVETIRFPGGYFAGPRFATCYYIKDYQGNNIAVVSGAAAAGKTQSTTYYPYGEPHRRPVSDPGRNSVNRYLFGDKEYTDYYTESQLDFGARYLAPSVIPHFTTMDPLCEVRPDESPYIYAAANPVMNIDPDGRDTYSVDSIGYITKLADDKEFDTVILQIGKSSKTIWQSECGNIIAIHDLKDKNNNNVGACFVVKNDNDGVNLFEALSDEFTNKHPMEWSILQTGQNSYGRNYVSTSRMPSTETSGDKILNILLKNTKKITIRSQYHNHPNNIINPSPDDLKLAQTWLEKTGSNIIFKIYLPSTHSYIEYKPQ